MSIPSDRATDLRAAYRVCDLKPLEDDYYPAIAETYLSKRAPKNEVGQAILFNTSVLEYNGKQRWNYPHPTVMKIDAFQQALKRLSATHGNG